MTLNPFGSNWPILSTFGAGFPSQTYLERVLSTRYSNLILGLPLGELIGPNAVDESSKGSNCTYALAGVTYGEPGIGDGKTSVKFSGADTFVNIDTSINTFDDDWNGNLFSMISWAKVVDSSIWTDLSTYRWMSHIRAADITYYATFGHSQTNNQLEWRRRTGGAIVSKTYTFAPGGPTDWFCAGMTFNLTGPLLSCYLWSSLTGFITVGTSNSASLTDWGNHPPQNGLSVLYAGSLTLQEWIGWGQHNYIWNTELTPAEMQSVMVL